MVIFTTPIWHDLYVDGSGRRPDRAKEVPMKTNQADEQRGVWITTFDRELRCAYSRQREGEDICSRRLVLVLENLEKFMGDYPNPINAVYAMVGTAKVDYWRDDAKQRGEGVQRGRVVQQFPTRVSESGQYIQVDLIDHRAIDPEIQAIQRDACMRLLKEVKPVVAKGLVLTAIAGYDQGTAAAQIGVTRTYLCRQIKQFHRTIVQCHTVAA